MPLLKANSSLRRTWLIENQSETVGYIAICFGYSIEFGGRDAFIDEFFIKEFSRGKGIGSKVLKEIKIKTSMLNIVALHLEVDRNNNRAIDLYAKLGFSSREQFHIMSCIL